MIALSLLLGSAFVALAALGLVRMPDLYARMHAAAKAGTFGGSLLLLGATVASGELVVWIKAALMVGFLFFTTPLASQLIGRAAYLRRVTMWEKTGLDELKGQYQESWKEPPRSV